MATKIEELVQRRFTSVLEEPQCAGKTVYDLFEWSLRDVHLTDYKVRVISTGSATDAAIRVWQKKNVMRNRNFHL